MREAEAVCPAGWLGVSADVVVFSVGDDALRVRLQRRHRTPFAGSLALPGTLLRDDESPEEGAQRVLGGDVGLDRVYREQLYTFGRPGRDPRGRVVAVAYFALVPASVAAGLPDGPDAAWHAVDALPPLAFDHAEMVAMAHRRLSAKLAYSTIALELMPERFTLSHLQGVYEVIGGEPLDKRNFRKRIGALECVEPTGETYRAGNHRPARLYRRRTPGRVEIIK
ncbi:hypothetical protein KBTX_01773 [wastewater metagenome]|uniref:Uncharacterized protein n=2 Tax=unclassified sequences TaxID=12908 RepID=A0A5B8R9M3_9ZZZZ|nr:MULTISPECIES: NUDIX domain-containing protein [Arhodomonas]QEA05450.1 hypothetical protein KBTEX_01773 [uncultured organism]